MSELYACVYAPIVGAAYDSLCAIAADFSPRFERHADALVVIDVAGLERLFGTPAAIGHAIRRAARDRGASLHVAVAATQTAAIVLACARPGLTVVPRGDEAVALAPLPIDALASACGQCGGRVGAAGARASGGGAPRAVKDADRSPDSAPISSFKQWGLRTLGELAALPTADLVARLGRPALVWQAIARGDDVRPLVPALEEERFESAMELEWPIEALEPLSFVLTRLLEPLSTRLERRDRGAAVLHIVLRLITRETCARRLELPAPMRDVRTLRTLALLDLEAHPAPAPIDAVTVVIDPTPARVLQHALFTRARAKPEAIATLVARLRALMGQDRIGAPARVDSYQPGAFAMTTFSDAGPQASRPGHEPSAISHQPCVTALRRCRRPVPARVALADEVPVRLTSERRGFGGGAVVHAAGPWRSSGNWWSACGPSEAPCWARDEWDVALADGAVYRIFRDRDTGAWFIDGVID